MIRRIAEISKRPVSFSLAQTINCLDGWRDLLDGADAANAAGYQVRAQIMARPISNLLGLDLSFNPFSTKPSFKAIAHLPAAERLKILRDPAFKAKVLAEEPVPDPQPLVNKLLAMTSEMYALGAEPNYAPPPQDMLGARAKALGVTVESLAYDLMLEDDGHAILCLPAANYADGNLDVVHEMMSHPQTVLGLGDGGAHYGVICDASYPSFVLDYWVRKAPEGQRFPLEWVVNALSRRPAETVGLMDRGLVQAGMKADLNIIDYDALRLYSPKPVYNLPTGGRRLQQKADGYVATIVNGEITYRDGQPTGALPGRLVRGDGYTPARRAAA